MSRLKTRCGSVLGEPRAQRHQRHRQRQPDRLAEALRGAVGRRASAGSRSPPCRRARRRRAPSRCARPARRRSRRARARGSAAARCRPWPGRPITGRPASVANKAALSLPGPNTSDGRTIAASRSRPSRASSASRLLRRYPVSPGSALGTTPSAETCTIRPTPASAAPRNSSTGPSVCTRAKLASGPGMRMPTQLTTASMRRARRSAAQSAGGRARMKSSAIVSPRRLPVPAGRRRPGGRASATPGRPPGRRSRWHRRPGCSRGLLLGAPGADRGDRRRRGRARSTCDGGRRRR